MKRRSSEGLKAKLFGHLDRSQRSHRMAVFDFAARYHDPAGMGHLMPQIESLVWPLWFFFFLKRFLAICLAELFSPCIANPVAATRVVLRAAVALHSLGFPNSLACYNKSAFKIGKLLVRSKNSLPCHCIATGQLRGDSHELLSALTFRSPAPSKASFSKREAAHFTIRSLNSPSL